MHYATIRFYAELNDFLPSPSRYQTLYQYFNGTPGVKDLIEAWGVPHPEVDLVLINGESVSFQRRVNPGDRISVYPMFESIDISSAIEVRSKPLRELLFVLDVHLGKLAKYLRMLGWDAKYANNAGDEELAEISFQERRVLLTRDRELLMRSKVEYGYYVRSTDPLEQLEEVLHRFDLFDSVRPFQRCIKCNMLLEPISKEEVEPRLPPKVKKHFTEFFYCPGCSRIFWKGTHYQKMQDFIATLSSRNNHRRKNNS